MCAQVSRGALHQRNDKALDVQVGVVGMTRMSASFGYALRDFSSRANAPVIFTVMAHDDEQEKLKQAQSIGAIDSFSKDLRGAVERAAVVLLDVPMGEQAAIIKDMARYLKPGAVVIDLSPLKGPGVKLAKEHFHRNNDGKLETYIVGATPLIRFSALYGEDDVSLAKPDLFGNGDMVIAPDASMPAEAVKVVNDIADFLNMSPRFMDPGEHDALAGLIEAMPLLQSALFFATVQQSSGQNDLLRLANVHFGNTVKNLHDKTAADLSTIWQWNRDNLLHHIEQMAIALESIREVLLDNDARLVEAFADQIIDGFTEWEIRRRDNRWDEEVDNAYQQVGTVGGMFNSFFTLGRRRKDDK